MVQDVNSGLLNHPINKRWPAENLEILQLYAYPTPNGVKASIALEEIGLDYEPHFLTLGDTDVKSPEFLALNPNNKIPAIFDPHGPDGTPVRLFESGAHLIYLAEKTGQLLPLDAANKYRAIQWLMFQMSGIGPMFGQLGYFNKFAGSEIEDQRPKERFINEAKRLLNVVENELEGNDWIAGSYSIADIALAPWLSALDYYEVKELVGWDEHKNSIAYLNRFAERPAVQRGRSIPTAN